MIRPVLLSTLLVSTALPSFAVEQLDRVEQPVISQIVPDADGRPWRMEIRPSVTLAEAQAEADLRAEPVAQTTPQLDAEQPAPSVPNSRQDKPVPAPVDAATPAAAEQLPEAKPAPETSPPIAVRDASSVTIRPMESEASKAAGVYRETLRALPYSRQMNAIRPGYRSELAVLITTGKTLPPVAQPGGFGDAGGFAPPLGFGGVRGFGAGQGFAPVNPGFGGYIPAQWDYYQSRPPAFRSLNPALYGF